MSRFHLSYLLQIFTLCMVFMGMALPAQGTEAVPSSTTPFRSYRTDDGLAHNKVWCALQDSYGFIWLGTENGLTRHDGNSCRNYYHDPAAPESLGNNGIHALMEDDGDIWVGTNNGVYIFRRHKDIFEFFGKKTKYKVTINCEVRRIFKASDGRIWIATLGQGAFVYDPSDDTLLQFNDQTSLVRNIFEDADRKIHVIAVGDDEFPTPDAVPVNLTGPDGDRIVIGNSSMTDNEGTLWVMTPDDGACFLPRNLRSIHYHSIPGGSAVNRVRCFVERGDGMIMVGTDNGIWVYDPSTDNLKKNPLYYSSKEITRISAMEEINGTLWIGTHGSGLFRYDLQRRTTRNYRHDGSVPGTLSSDDVLCISPQTRNDLIEIGTSFGLCEYRPQQDVFTPRLSIGSMSEVNSICEAVDGMMWVATSNIGLYCNNIRNGEWKNYSSVWTGDTFFETGNIISSMQDSEGRLWLGLDGNGPALFNMEKDRMESLPSIAEAMRKESIFSMQEDRIGNVWMAGSKGLSVISPSYGIRTFGTEDGLKSSRFSANASIRTSDGLILFGDSHGFYDFLPEQLKQNTYAPPVYITTVRVQDMDKPSQISNGFNLLEGNKLPLSYKENNFEVTVAVLSYVSPHKNRCRYKLSGYDKDWKTGAPGTIAYQNLSPGDYTLTVYGINNDGYESSEPAVLHISIAPPWWLSYIAFLIYAMIILGAVVFFMLWWNRRLAEQYRKKEEENAIAQEQEANKSKIRFFVNLVHEIRTPLSMITLPLERLKEETRRDDKYIQIIDKNVEYLLSVTNQLLEFQKMDSNHLDLNKTEFHIKKLLDDLRKQFDTAGSKEDVELILEAPDEDMIIYADKDRVRTILINLLNNAVKHAVSHIGIALVYGSDQIEVRVENDGTPIPENEKEKIFDLFYQVRGSNNAALGTGIGLSFSKQLAEAHGGRLVLNDFEGGASFSLILPLEKAPATTFFENMNKVVDQAVTPSDDTLIDDKDESCTILVVEDNPGLLKLVSDTLGRWYKVLSAACGEDALKLLESNDVTIVVSDVMMPGISGIELCQQIRSDINTSHIPVILLTAKTTVEAKVEGMEAGAVVYMEKPFSMRQLHLQIENLRTLRRALGEEKDLQAVTSGDGSSAADFALGSRDMEFIEKLNKVVAERIKADGCNVDMVADMMNMSRRSFQRKVTALFGMPPSNYILKYKMQLAAKLLDEGFRVNEVSDMLNFSATSYFAKCFKAEYGVNPKEYQKQED